MSLISFASRGGAGPGGCDAGLWRDVLLRFGAYSSRLRDAVAALACRLLNSIVPWEDISALVVNHLIALDKCPGVHPIGIGETLRHVVGKAVCYATRVDVELACGSDQPCGSVRSGIEGAIHTMTSLFLQHGATSGWGVPLVDASNAFNSLNRVALLWNVRILWPCCSSFVFNTFKAGQHWLPGAPMNTCIVWKVLLRKILCLCFCILLVHSH